MNHTTRDYDLYAYLGKPASVLKIVDACNSGLASNILLAEGEKTLVRAYTDDVDWYKPWLDGTRALFILVTTGTGAVGWVAVGPGRRWAYRYEDAGISDLSQAIAVFHALTEIKHKPVRPTYLSDIFLSHIDEKHETSL